MADEVGKALLEVVVATVDAKHVQGTTQSQVASFFVQAEASVAKMINVMEGRVQQLPVL